MQNHFTLLLSIICLVTCLSSQGLAEPVAPIPTEEEKTSRLPWSDERLINYAVVYGAQWAFYLVSQNKEIKKSGSFDNWVENIQHPHLDRDGFDFNLFKHSLVGNYYYLFYRSRGYTSKDAFYWSFASSLAFEITIETVTEPPSFQDIYQTPVFGVILGYGAEKLSAKMHHYGGWLGHGLGYFLNPFSLLPSTATIFVAPNFDPKFKGLTLVAEF